MTGPRSPGGGPPPPPPRKLGPPPQPPAGFTVVAASPAPTPTPTAPTPSASQANLSLAPSLELERRPLGEILLEMGAITPEQLSEALSAQHLEDERVGETLVRLDHCSELDVTRALGRQFALPINADLSDEDIDDALCEQLPIGYARSNLVLPWRLDRDGEHGFDRVDVLAADPLKLDELDDLASVYDAEVEVSLTTPSRVLELINKTYAKRTKDVDLEKKEDEYGEEDEDILHASAEDAPIIRFVNSLIFNASKSKASDIHIEPGDKEV
ncbi:MAG TPA: hypothetical protein VK034_24445, partial [Enhygromyxa sp.]|nr:hypothetical protein [Enhygromyxa sp.]